MNNFKRAHPLTHMLMRIADRVIRVLTYVMTISVTVKLCNESTHSRNARYSDMDYVDDYVEDITGKAFNPDYDTPYVRPYVGAHGQIEGGWYSGNPNMVLSTANLRGTYECSGVPGATDC